MRILRSYQIEEFTLMHSSFYTYRLARNNGLKNNILLRCSKHKHNYAYYDCLENRINKNQYYFKKLIKSVKDRIEQHILQNKIFWIFNGNQYTAKNILFEFKKFDTKILFFEVGNFKSKIQIGLGGTNSNNEIYKNIYEYEVVSTLKPLTIDYFSNNESKLRVPLSIQFSELIFKKILFKNIRLPIYPRNIFQVFNKLIGRIFCKYLFRFFNKRIKDPESNFIFLGQVKNDSQLVMANGNAFSSVSILNKALEICNSKEKEMIYRFHPREYNIKAVIEVLSWCRKHNVPISNRGNLEDLSNTYPGFVTFNSTAGLQLISKSKDVYCIDPKCFYKNWTKFELDYFISKILLPVADF